MFCSWLDVMTTYNTSLFLDMQSTTNQIRRRLLRPGWPSVFLCSIGSWSRRFLCGLIRPIRTCASFPRELWSSRALRVLQRIEAASQGLSRLFAQQYRAGARWASLWGMSAPRQPHTHTPSSRQPWACCLPPFHHYLHLAAGSGHNMKRILAICGRLLTNQSTDCFFFISSLSASTLTPTFMLLLQLLHHQFAQITKQQISSLVHQCAVYIQYSAKIISLSSIHLLIISLVLA